MFKSDVLKGSIILLSSGLLVKMLGAFYRIPLSNILGAEGMGVYQMIFPIFSLALILTSGGVGNTLAYSISKSRAEGKDNIKTIFFQGFFYSFGMGIFFALLFFFLSLVIAEWQGNILANFGYKMSAFALLFASLLAPFRGLFQGFQNMTPTAVSQIVEQVFKVGLGLFFASLLVKRGLDMGVLGGFLGIAVGEIFAFMYLLFLRTKTIKFKKYDINLKNIAKKSKKIKKNMFFLKNKEFLCVNFKITASTIMIPLLLAFDSFVVVNLLNQTFSERISTSLYGLQSGLVNSLVNFPVVVSVAISLAILPSISFLFAKGKTKVIEEKLKNVFKILWLFLLPCIVSFIVLSPFILNVLYPAINESFLIIAEKLLQISAFEILFISVLQISISVFQGIGRQKLPILILGVCGGVKILLTIFLVSIPSINIYGLAFSNLLFYGLSGGVAFWFLKKFFTFSLDFKDLIVSTFSSVVLCCYFMLIQMGVNGIYVKGFLFAVGVLILYILPLVLLKVINIKVIWKNFLLLKDKKNE